MLKFLICILAISMLSCSNTDDGNTILPSVPVNETIFLNNPNALSLKVPTGSITIPGGIAGIIVYNFNDSQFFAWDRACPHLAPQTCSRMNVVDVFWMDCPCDDSRFSILDGAPQSGSSFAARQYRVIKNGNTLIITNF
jgi:nitrite reductase/ring-hydroxylating ferredoxin subunit